LNARIDAAEVITVDGGTGLVDTLSKDIPTKTVAKSIGNLEIKSQADRFQGWTLTVDRRFSPTSEDWGTVEKIADYILIIPPFFIEHPMQ
jgi:hypothetical protein